MRAVDDTKNHLTYFVRVDLHLLGRELSRMSEVAVIFAPCLHHGLAWLLAVRAVDDTKNHLTYFVRVDWHLPGRELSRMSEVAVVVAHVCIMGWHG